MNIDTNQMCISVESVQLLLICTLPPHWVPYTLENKFTFLFIFLYKHFWYNILQPLSLPTMKLGMTWKSNEHFFFSLLTTLTDIWYNPLYIQVMVSIYCYQGVKTFGHKLRKISAHSVKSLPTSIVTNSWIKNIK